VAADVNAGHLAVAVVTPDGNMLGVPFTMPLELAAPLQADRSGPPAEQYSLPPSD
jgi:hypothetical protein